MRWSKVYNGDIVEFRTSAVLMLSTVWSSFVVVLAAISKLAGVVSELVVIADRVTRYFEARDVVSLSKFVTSVVGWS